MSDDVERRPSEIRRLSKDETIAVYKRHMIAQSERAEAAEAREATLREALDWIQKFCQKMPRAGVYGGHTGFVHIERRIRAALAKTAAMKES